jgi:hypothetical protein
MQYSLIFLLLLTSAHVQAASDQDLASLFYPPALSTWVRDNPGLAEQQQWSSASADLDHTGAASYLVVAYSNGHIGRLRIIKKTSSGPILVADPDTPALYDDHPSLRLLDLDHDGNPEIIVTYHVGNHGERATWIFGWDGTSVRTLNPPDPDNAQNVIAFREPDFVDVNGDGRLAVVEPSDSYGVHEEFATPEAAHPVTPDRTCNLYQLSNGRFANAPRAVAYYGHFARAKGKPKAIEESFAARPGSYVLRVANGNAGKDLVDSAEVKLNGIVVLSPAAFGSEQGQHEGNNDSPRAVITVPVTLRDQNALSVEVRSAPGSQLRVVIEPAQ